jgi:hypothetical protein
VRAALISNYSLNRQHTIQIQMLKVCIKLHSDNDTQNFYLKHYQGLEYLNMAIAQVTDIPLLLEVLPFINRLNRSCMTISALISNL